MQPPLLPLPHSITLIYSLSLLPKQFMPTAPLPSPSTSSSTAHSLLSFQSLVAVSPSMPISPGDACVSAQFSLNAYLPVVKKRRKTQKEWGTDRERELDSEQNPDFINVGLLIWAWAALHLSQRERHTKQAATTHSETRPSTHTHTHTQARTHGDTQQDATAHKLTQTRKSTRSKLERQKTGALSAVPLCLTSKQKIDCEAKQHPVGTTPRPKQSPWQSKLLYSCSPPKDHSLSSKQDDLDINSSDYDSQGCDRPHWINICTSLISETW